MSKKGNVFFKDTLAGSIEETGEGDFIFRYDQDYLKSSKAKPLSYSLPLQKEAFSSQYLKGFFDGLMPEGWILNLVTQYWKFHPIRDRYQLLLKTSFDPVGAVSIIEENINEKPEFKNPLVNNNKRELVFIGKCLLCYKELENGEYHKKCSQQFFEEDTPPQIDLDKELFEKISMLSISKGLTVPGVQKKLTLDLTGEKKNTRLTLTNYAGKFILKPKSKIPHVPENEDLIMKMAGLYGIQVASNTLIRLKDGELGTLSKRLDRKNHGTKLHMEDFCQILDQVTDKKYTGSYQKVGKTLLKYCAQNAPADQALRLYELIIFSYLVGNADLHLKNISVLHDPLPRLAPAYDLLSFEIYQEDFKERDLEIMALSINGKKNKFTHMDFIVLAESLQISEKVQGYILKKFQTIYKKWQPLIKSSFLPESKQDLLIKLIETRLKTFRN